MLDVGVLVETLETATFWSRVEQVYADVQAALEARCRAALVLCHVSHVYETGCSLYFTVAAKAGDRPEATLARRPRPRRPTRWSPRARPSPTTTPSASTTGPGWRTRSATLGVRVLRAVKAELDPTGVLNPGVLVP